jgi:NADPH-dependent 2,4-dienoyl-CoA reductase/sulfur reductase-like enzyme
VSAPAPSVDRIVIVGASLAGLRAAETVRAEGFSGHLTLIGDEPHEPYDRPPLSKQVLTGWIPADGTALPRRRPLDAQWRLGVAATGLDLERKEVALADGDRVPFDRVLIATGTRARRWPNPEEAALDGVLGVRRREDGAQLRERLVAGPRRVLVIGGGFAGSEIASACRELDLPVTLAEAGRAPLVNALGHAIGGVAAGIQRDHGVDLRCGVTVVSLEHDAGGAVRGALLSDGDRVEADVAVVALGAVRNVEWLDGSGLAVGPRGVACDAGCRAFDANGVTTDDVFVAGDVARFPHPLYGYQLIALEHWDNAVAQAEVAAHNMVCPAPQRRPHLPVPAFWSTQFGVNIKSVGIPSFSDSLMVTQGSMAERRFVAAFGYRGRITAAVAFDEGKWLDFYDERIREASPFPPRFAVSHRPGEDRTFPAEFPDPYTPSHSPTVQLTGHQPSERRALRLPAAQ